MPRNLSPLLILALAPLAPAQTDGGMPIRLVRDPALSPDGRTLYFSWRGDLWTAPTAGGAARRLTAHPARDVMPRVSPDGREIAFVSDRTGSMQVFTMPAAGGAPRPVTSHTEGYRLIEWAPDGNGFLVSATRDHWWRRAERLFLQPRDGARAPRLLFDDYGSDGTLSRDGNLCLFVRESPPVYRKGYRGSQEGQLWLLHRDRGIIGRLHEGDANCRWPLWAPDGQTHYYVSGPNLVRAGMVTDERTELTRYTDDGVLFPAISRDGSTIVFLHLFDLWRLDPATGEVKKIGLFDAGDPTLEVERRTTLDRAQDVAVTDDGREVAFAAGGDIWVMDTELREPVAVTRTPEEERDPVFTPDHKTLVFVSDQGGQSDLWTATRADEKQYWWRNTGFTLKRLTEDPEVESRLRVYDQGRRLAWVRGAGDLMTMELGKGAPDRLVTSWNPPSFDISPDDRWLAWAVDDDDFNSDVWVMPLDRSREPFNLSCHPDDDDGPVWSPDGKALAFTGRRAGDEWDIWYVYLAREKDDETARHRKLEEALKKMEGRDRKKKDPKAGAAAPAAPKTDDDLSGTWEGKAQGPAPFPADGLPFTLTMALDGSKVTGSYTSSQGSGNVEGTFERATGAIRLTVTIDGETMSVEGRVEAGKATGTWELQGARFEWSAQRTSAPDKSAKPAPGGSKDEKKEEKKDEKDEGTEKDADEPVKVRIDFEGIRDRLRRVTIPNSRETGLIWSPDSKKLLFNGSWEGKAGSWTIEFPDKFTPKAFTPTPGGGGRWLKEGNQVVWLQAGVPTSVTAEGKATAYAFSAPQLVSVPARNRALFDQAWRTMRDRFYDERLGNRDWTAVRQKYAPLAETCLDEDSLETVVGMMLGELNGSHLGFNIREPAARADDKSWREVTGHLGARFDPAFEGPGLRIRDVIEGTPADRVESRLRPGEVILSIDGTSVSREVEIAKVLTGRAERDVRLQVRDAEGKERSVTIRPATYGAVRGRLYEKWLEDNRAQVEKLSRGSLGYVHIASMGEGNLVRFDTELYRQGHGKDGLVIDVRDNGGGSIADHLLTCLTQPEHAVTRPRGGGEGYPQDRRVYATWSKPIVVLCNQNSFSNAEIFSHAVKTLRRGRLVGVPTAGGVISTGATSLMDLATIRLPFRGWYTPDGEDMELHGCVPDLVIWPQPGELAAGVDKQLEKAVEFLREDVNVWKSRPRPKLRKASER